MHQSLLSEATLFANILLSSHNKHVSPQKHHFKYWRQFQCWLQPMMKMMTEETSHILMLLDLRISLT